MQVSQEKWLWRGAATVGLLLIIVPEIDLSIARLFYLPGHEDPSLNFILRGSPLFEGIHNAISRFSQLAGLILFGILAYAAIRRRKVWGLGSLGWLFLVLALVVGPGLLANEVFKNHWGRSRPSRLVEFGGEGQFTPPLVLANQCLHNCSFVCGDAAMAFYPHAFAYIHHRRRTRRLIMAGSIGAGLAVGLMRIGMGAHFFSDVLFAGALILASTAVLHALIYGRATTRALWREWLACLPPTSPNQIRAPTNSGDDGGAVPASGL
ncbi:lipid A 4'-phosphatase [uncultured Gammaproteobacteria bacterium]